MFFLKLFLFSNVPHQSVSSGWFSRCVNDAQPKVPTGYVPNISDLRIWTCIKKYTRNINGALPAPGAIKACAQPLGQHSAASWRTVDRYARRWEALRRTQFASAAYLLTWSFSPSFLWLLQSVLTWLSWGIKLLKLKWIQEAIFGLQVRITVKSVWIFNVCVGSPVSFKLMF